ncbi:hypothetical protein EAMG_04729 [Escherichia coli M056]|nr:hypothetical protein EAMG_04729 [Escherichia coli M056]
MSEFSTDHHSLILWHEHNAEISPVWCGLITRR